MNIPNPKIGKQYNRLVKVEKIVKGEIRVIWIDGRRFTLAENKFTEPEEIEE